MRLQIHIEIEHHRDRDEQPQNGGTTHYVERTHDGIEETAFLADIETATRQRRHHFPRQHRQSTLEDRPDDADHEEQHQCYGGKHQHLPYLLYDNSSFHLFCILRRMSRENRLNTRTTKNSMNAANISALSYSGSDSISP